MPDSNQQGAKPAPAAPRPDNARRDKFFLAVVTAVLTRQSGRSPIALARECVDYTDAFLAALDAPTGA